MNPGTAGGVGRATPARPTTAYPLQQIETIRLADGRALMLRPVMPHDAVAEAAFVANLSPASRRLRFHGALKSLPDSVLMAMTRIDHQQQVALVAQALDARGRAHLVADARYVVDAAQQSAEFAIAVADAWQGVGLGRALMQRLVQQARAQGLRHLHGAVLHDNLPMLHLMQQLGAQVSTTTEDDALQMRFALDDTMPTHAGEFEPGTSSDHANDTGHTSFIDFTTLGGGAWRDTDHSDGAAADAGRRGDGRGHEWALCSH
jgi:L-amino acid N-acyltransferase YncA